jgi:predicted ATPase
MCYELIDGRFTTHIDPNGKPVPDSSPFETAALALPVLGSWGNKTLAALQQYFVNMKYYALIPDLLRAAQQFGNEYELAEHGENSASVLNRMIEDHAPVLSELQVALTHVIADIRDIRVQQAGRHLITEFQHAYPDGALAWFDAAQESDGTLRLFGLLLAAYQPSINLFLAIEEPELALHPGAMGLLSDILQGLEGRTQLLLTTQSPDLVARFGATQLRIVEKLSGRTEIGRLDESQREIINRELFSGGDLLRIEGLHREESLVG